MRVHTGLEAAAVREPGCVVAVGNFDGVHIGHQAIFASARKEALARGCSVLVLTFAQHPVSRLQPHRAPSPLMTLEDRLGTIGDLGVDSALVLPFEDELASMPPETFVRKVLVGALKASAVVVGRGWRFGRDRAGDDVLLADLGRRYGYDVFPVPGVLHGGLPVSSTRIRESLARGDVVLARELLGRPHYLRGVVVEGRGTGRRLGFPTVNLASGEVMLPSRGVYAAGCRAGSWEGPAAVNIGVRPTFGNGVDLLEAHLLGFDGHLYGVTVTLAFQARLREELAFSSAAELSAQIRADVARVSEQYDPSVLKGVRP